MPLDLSASPGPDSAGKIVHARKHLINGKAFHDAVERSDG